MLWLHVAEHALFTVNNNYTHLYFINDDSPLTSDVFTHYYRITFSYLVIADQYIYILRPTEDENTYVIKLRHKVSSIMRITKKARMPDAIKIEYGTSGLDGAHITDTVRLHIPKKAGKLLSISNKPVKMY